MSTSNVIRLKGVRQNNLKNFDLDLPLGKLIVVTGLSGTGKSSLVFDTLHAEGQSRYVETFSPYTRQFLEMLERPNVDSIENIRPSIAIQQSNSVKTSRSTVGTMTELCDFFKVWFCHVSDLFDPETGEKIEDDTPEKVWKKIIKEHQGKTLLIGFEIKKPEKLSWCEIISSLQKQGYARILIDKKIHKLSEISEKEIKANSFHALQDRVEIKTKSKNRFIEAAKTAFHFGQGELHVFSDKGSPLAHYSQGLHSPKTGKSYKPASPALFSFNSPIGACPDCRGFGRVIEIDYNLVIPNKNLSLDEGAIRPFNGNVYQESLNDLKRFTPKKKLRFNVPWKDLTDKEKEYIIEGDPSYEFGNGEWPDKWYGIKNFFKWLDTKLYKMHVRVFLSKYRSYITCPNCEGKRLQSEALNWKWKGYTLPDLYNLSVSALYKLLQESHAATGNIPADLAIQSILSRLRYLEEVGLGYLSLNRTSRTLSGGETERVSLTSCLGTSLVETLFILDEPSIGLHAHNIDKLIHILKRLTDLGNTVVVVEHDEAVMRAADHIIELGPKPGNQGGAIMYAGKAANIIKHKTSITGAYLSGKKNISLPTKRRPIDKKTPYIEFKKISKHNIENLSFKLPLERLVCLSGVSGSGKSTLLNNAIYQGLLANKGLSVDSPAVIDSILPSQDIEDIVLVDQSPLSKTPRSNPALYVDAWDFIRNLFAATDEARSADMSASFFSFNSGQGRCEHCQGLGSEKVEMQFLSDIYVPCAICESKRFKPETLKIKYNDKSIADVLALDIHEAIDFFEEHPKIANRLRSIQEVGLGYLQLGQPINTLSGGEAQRIKLVKYLSRIDSPEKKSLLLLDEPTTGLHRDDIQHLVKTLHRLVDDGHSVVVIEHNMDILKCADWIIEMGPEAGGKGGKIVIEGTPEDIAKAKTQTAPFLKQALKEASIKTKGEIIPFPSDNQKHLIAAEPDAIVQKSAKHALTIRGAREHNLKNISLSIPHNQLVVVTGVSGSGKSSLAFDIIFTEGQRRFMESMSAYARQFVEQLPKPEIDQLQGIPPTVAIEQRVTRGSRKSTVATVTEVAQYLRLLYTKIGTQYSPTTGEAVISLTPSALKKNLQTKIRELSKKRISNLYLCAPLIQSRKGHHEPLANWLKKHDYELMRVNGKVIPVSSFKKLDRFKEHDIEAVVEDLKDKHCNLDQALTTALRLGKGSCFLLVQEKLIWLSTSRVDPTTGEAFPELDPKHFSWNSPKGWCPTCRGYGKFFDWMKKDENFTNLPSFKVSGTTCTACHGNRINKLSCAVKLAFTDKHSDLSLPELLKLTPGELLKRLGKIKTDTKGKRILQDIIPQIRERLAFMKHVGLSYLSLDRSSSTLSGGEAQRIRLASQLGTNLSGVLYVLDEPSIGLHARDNKSLIQSLKALRDKGNSLLVVEHDEETLREADYVIDLGPGAGKRGGEILEAGPLRKLLKNKNSITGEYLRESIQHPLQGSYRKLPVKTNKEEWLELTAPRLRNLKGGNLKLPLSKLIVFCGISGAGKSTLVRGLLKPVVEAAIQSNNACLDYNSKLNFEDHTSQTPPFKSLINGNKFKKVIEVDQEPIGKTPRSTPATYIGAFDIIRDIFSSLPEAKIRGFTAGTFSFNTQHGRCEDCKGAGRVKLEMNFLPDTYVKCENCNGGRYSSTLDDIRWNGKNMSEILELTFEEGVEFFSFHSKLKDLCTLMVETGLGYLTLGQSSPTLSGGEAQRLKLVSELVKGLPTFKEKTRGTKFNNLYILEEPTIGLHLSDCKRLIQLLHRLVDQGHTVIVIEHHLDVIAEADYVVEIGPEGGESGGHILHQGTVDKLKSCKKSVTADFLTQIQPA